MVLDNKVIYNCKQLLLLRLALKIHEEIDTLWVLLQIMKVNKNEIFKKFTVSFIEVFKNLFRISDSIAMLSSKLEVFSPQFPSSYIDYMQLIYLLKFITSC